MLFRKNILKTIDEIDSDVSKLSTPHERITFRTYLLIMVVLAVVVSMFWNIIKADKKAQVNDLKQIVGELKQDLKEIKKDNLILKLKIDSLIQEVFQAKMERYEEKKQSIKDKTETVIKLKKLVTQAKENLR